MYRVAIVFGTRPEAIKMAPIVQAMSRDARFHVRVCATAQHRQMLDQVLDVFDIRPDHDLNLMAPDQTLANLTARLLEALDRFLLAESPDLVLAQGDTTTAFCAALAAFYRRVPVGHVEAGLRTGNLYSPWPEEANRILVSRLAALHFAPTEASRANLLREGVLARNVAVTGNTVIDALFLALERIAHEPPAIPGLPDRVLRGGDRIILITGHRRENLGHGFEQIYHALAELARRFPDIHFVYPVHLNPRVREPVERILNSVVLNNVYLLEPLPYLPFVALMQRSVLILTDSGGVQEEAPSLGKPVLVFRDSTERPEAVQAGTVRLVGPSYAAILAETTRLLTDPVAYGAMARAANPYGDGRAAGRIVARCADYLNQSPAASTGPLARAG